jgi:hypothetical protein
VGGGVGVTKIQKNVFIVLIKKILPDTFIWFDMCRIIFVLHLNPYFLTVDHCPGGWGYLKD